MFSSHDIRQAGNGHNMCFGYERAAYPHNGAHNIVPLSSSGSPSFTDYGYQNYPYITYVSQSPPLSKQQVPQKRVRRRDPSHIPRPRNAFFIFRSSYVASPYTTTGKEHQNDLSRQAAHVWSMMTEDQKRPFRVRADIEMEEHKQKYPDFNYSTKGCSKARKSKSAIPGEKTMMWTWLPSSSPGSFFMNAEVEGSTIDYNYFASPDGPSHNHQSAVFSLGNMLAYTEHFCDSEAFLPDPPALCTSFSNNDVSHQLGISTHPTQEGKDAAFPSHTGYSSTVDIESSFSDIFLSMVDNINPQDYESSYPSSALYNIPSPGSYPSFKTSSYL